MSFWRAAGLNYVQYSNVAARCVRAALKKDLQVNSRTQRYSYCYIFSLSVGFLDSEPKDPKHVAGSGSEFFFSSHAGPERSLAGWQCCGSASIIMRIWIQDPKNVHMDPDPRG